MKKLIFAAAITAICFGMTACGNIDEAAESPRDETTATTTTTAAATTASSLPLTTAAETTSVVTTSPEVTTTPEQVTTTTAAATEKKTSATTKKVTTTTKKVTTTAKPKPVTTTKKVTTTAKATTTKKVTTTAKPTTLRITQSDVDKLVKELQEYSNSLETATKTDKVFYDSIVDEYGSVEKYLDINVEYVLAHLYDEPHIANGGIEYPGFSWDAPETIFPSYSYSYAYDLMKSSIYWTYKTSPECHIVIYAKWCPNGKGSTDPYRTSDLWDLYLLRC